MWIRSIAAGFSLVTCVAAVPSAHGATVNIAVSSRYEDPGFLVVMPQSCDAGQPGVCSFSGTGMATFTGTLNGFTEYHALGSVDPITGVVTFQVWERFTGTIARCGAGSVRWYLSGTANMSEFDPVTMTLPLNATWRLLAGTGTGQLARTTGAGRARGPINPFTRENHGTFTGRIACQR